MNERIKELINEATSFKEGLIEGKHGIEVFDKEKFAELIVKECNLVLCDMINDNHGDFDTLDMALTEINEHFGVEE
jgi:hypothetical protein